ncbi:MAG: hypothetical protein N2688_01625, partial [Burkholderiaceae bacterium]|nr:hypothetical protein [Burkholderiaceae bacterium]
NNQILGVLSFTMGLSSLGTENVTFYAWVGLMFVALVWGVSTQRFTRHLRMLQVIEHPRGAPFYILKRSFVAFVGIGFLASVAVGFLTKTGLQWL